MGDVITRFKLESTQYDSALRTASKGLTDFAKQAQKAGEDFSKFKDKNVEAARSLGNIPVSATNAKDKLKELVGAFNDAAKAYNSLSKEQQQSDFGKGLAQSIQTLKGRIGEAKQELYGLGDATNGGGKKFGQLGDVIDTLGKKIGLTTNATELLTSKTALMYAGIGAGIAVLTKATTAWVEYNKELSKQDQITTVTTGLTGNAANYMTDSVRALADTYQVDFREAINAANTLMMQFGKTGEESIQLLKDGMQGMIMGDGPKMLNMIQQFAPAFVDAGISAEQLVAIIHNSEGGLFSDQNMNAILMGIKNIRLMTKTTSDDLAKLGIDGQEMSRKMSQGSMTVFEALREVAQAIEGCSGASKEAGKVMQDVFGKQGAMSGMKLGRAIAELNTNLEETKKQTGELGDAYAELQTANENLNIAIRECFSYDGWEQMATGIKATLIDVLADVIEKLGTIKSLLTGMSVSQVKQSKYGTSGTPEELTRDLEALQKADEKDREGMYQQMLKKYEKRVQASAANLSKAQSSYDEWSWFNPNDMGIAGKWKRSNQVKTATSDVQVEQDIMNEFKKRALSIINKVADNVENSNDITPTGKTGKLKPEEVEFARLSEVLGKIRNSSRADNLQPQIKSPDEMTPGFPSMKELQAELSNYKNLLATATTKAEFDSANRGIAQTQGAIAAQPLALKMGISIDEAEVEQQFQNLKDNLETYFKDNPISINVGGGISEDGELAQKKWQLAAKAVQDVGTAFSQIEDPASKVAGTIAQAIASIALGYATATAQAAQLGPWAWIAFAAAGLATTIATITSIKSATSGYEQGGIIKGNSYSGDRIGGMVSGELIGLDAGEVVLTRAMQGSLAAQLNDSARNGGGISSSPYVTGEKIVLGINNYARRHGMGELVFSHG